MTDIAIDYEEMYDAAVDEIEQLKLDRDSLLAHIDDLYLRIEALENQLDRTRMDNVSMAYRLGGPNASL